MNLSNIFQFQRLNLSKYFFRFENHEECDNGGDDSETSNKSNNDEDPSRIFVCLVISCVFVDPKMLTIKHGEGEAPVPVNIAGEPLRVLQVRLLVPAA